MNLKVLNFEKILQVTIFFIILNFQPGFSQYHGVRYPHNPVIVPEQSKGIIAHNDPALYYDGEDFHLWLTGGGFVPNDTVPGVRIYYFTSRDAQVWSYAETNPVFLESQPGYWDSGHIETPSVIRVGDEYWMYYMATPDSAREKGEQLQLGLAQSTDGMHWTRHAANPLLARGNTGTWDERWIESPCVVKTDSLFYLWYTGVGPDWKIQVGLSTSRDGIIWKKYETNPVFSPVTARIWESVGVYAPQVRLIGNVFVMLYTGIRFNETGYDYSNTNTGLAFSNDGIHWDRATDEPILSGVANAWDAAGPFTLDWVIAEERLVMVYISDLKVGLATSANEISAIKAENQLKTVQLQIYQNFPNPFNAETVLQYYLFFKNDVTIEIFDLLGRSIKKISLTNQSSGLHTMRVNFDDMDATLPGGIYFCQMKTEGRMQTRKMIYLR